MNPSWLETQELITATCEQPAAARERFVREHCVDPALRETMSALVRTAVGGVSSAASQIQPDLPPGSQVGPYVILHRLGRGGMGEVFLGRDPRLERLVALKCLFSSHAGGDTLRARIIREARAAARISHAHVATVHDVLEHDGRAFIVMEYEDGESLAELLKREPLPPDRVIAIGRQIVSALAAAHAKGVIHRDLKPANIQVTPDGSIKILDFGIATALATVATTTTSTAVTLAAETRGPQPGTPAYMSPEHLLGRVVDERSDLFSLGVILFEMATGRRPFTSNNPLDVLMAAVRRLPRADSLDPKVPAPLADAIAKALAADPVERFQSATEMGVALDAARDGISATATRRDVPTPIPAPRPTWQFRRLAIMVGAVPLVLWSLGRLSSAAFNATMGRFGPFAADPAQAHLVLGIRSLVGPAVYAALVLMALWAVPFLFRVLALISPVARTVDTVTGRWNALTARLGLNEPIALAQALSVLGVCAIAGVIWKFSPLIDALVSNIGIAPASVVWRLSPANSDEKVLYRAVLTVLFLAFGAGLIRVLHLRARLGTRAGRGSAAALGIIVGLLLLMNEMPYRILWKSNAMRAEYSGARCYVIGEDRTRMLLYCPGIPVPRNRVVDKTDARFRSTGIIENIFSKPE
jgi:serine/threonine protein kinase